MAKRVLRLRDIDSNEPNFQKLCIYRERDSFITCKVENIPLTRHMIEMHKNKILYFLQISQIINHITLPRRYLKFGEKSLTFLIIV